MGKRDRLPLVKGRAWTTRRIRSQLVSLNHNSGIIASKKLILPVFDIRDEHITLESRLLKILDLCVLVRRRVSLRGDHEFINFPAILNASGCPACIYFPWPQLSNP